MNEIMTISGVSCYEKDGTAYLYLEAVARGLGFTEKKGDVEYVMWRRVDGYLTQLGFGTCAERPSYVPENIFYRLAMKAKNETAERFQALVADEIIPSIRKTGMYMSGSKELRAIFMLDNRTVEHEQRISALEGSMVVDYAQQRTLANLVNEIVVKALGGKESAAYNDKSIRGKTYCECNQNIQAAYELNIYSQNISSEYHKDKPDAEKYERNGIAHNVFRNEDVWTVVWIRDNIECFLTIDCQEDALYQILDSIYTMEG